jgi:hypothetical protein
MNSFEMKNFGLFSLAGLKSYLIETPLGHGIWYLLSPWQLRVAGDGHIQLRYFNTTSGSGLYLVRFRQSVCSF